MGKNRKDPSGKYSFFRQGLGPGLKRERPKRERKAPSRESLALWRAIRLWEVRRKEQPPADAPASPPVEGERTAAAPSERAFEVNRTEEGVEVSVRFNLGWVLLALLIYLLLTGSISININWT